MNMLYKSIIAAGLLTCTQLSAAAPLLPGLNADKKSVAWNMSIAATRYSFNLSESGYGSRASMAEEFHVRFDHSVEASGAFYDEHVPGLFGMIKSYFSNYIGEIRTNGYSEEQAVANQPFAPLIGDFAGSEHIGQNLARLAHELSRTDGFNINNINDIPLKR